MNFYKQRIYLIMCGIGFLQLQLQEQEDRQKKNWDCYSTKSASLARYHVVPLYTWDKETKLCCSCNCLVIYNYTKQLLVVVKADGILYINTDIHDHPIYGLATDSKYVFTPEPLLSWSHGSWISNYLCNQCLSSLMLWVRILIRARCKTLCDKLCQWLATGWWFSPGPTVSSTNKTDRHDITKILLKVALNTIKQICIQYMD